MGDSEGAHTEQAQWVQPSLEKGHVGFKPLSRSISFRKTRTQVPKLPDKMKWASPAAPITLRPLSSPNVLGRGSLMPGHGAQSPPDTGAMLPPSVWSQSSAVLARYAPSRDTAFHLQGLWPALILVGVLTVLHML